MREGLWMFGSLVAVLLMVLVGTGLAHRASQAHEEPVLYRVEHAGVAVQMTLVDVYSCSTTHCKYRFIGPKMVFGVQPAVAGGENR